MLDNDTKNTILVIHNIRSAANVGSMFRTADGAGVQEIWLTGYTPSPAKWNQKYLTKAEKSLAKAALGAEYFIPWKRGALLGSLISQLRSLGYLVIGLEQSEQSVSFDEIKAEQTFVLIVGNEVRGLDSRILKQCDVIGELPMYGKKNSLNVSVACGIALYALRDIIKKSKKNIC
ncbi:MAG: TrmH family RNA methyltransferase [Candidatus Moranbacteria bacterium]|jgi:23S rRNA (guanosine2251-2'-O)-methyltransferase|nr:TrmH family RNA methyltransferase [Candidatus Moranbacteria bacterium]MBP9801246.1 TrmH family RNA methyltransferase [Candidatus Moranbacteria bacterium]